MKQKLFKNITIDPKIRFGKPIIAGTRVPVEIVVGKIAGGLTVNEVCKEYEITREQVLSALQYAAKLVSEEEIIFA